MMPDSGYPLEWFVESLDTYLVCGICGQVLKNPRATKCGHVFCRKCLHTWIDEYGVCPERCGEVELESLRRATQIDKKISCLLTHCKYSKAGCKAILQLADKGSHEKRCHYAKKSVSKTRSFPFFNLGNSSLSQPEHSPSSHPQQRSKSFNRSRLLQDFGSISDKDKGSTCHRSQVITQKHQRSKSLGIGTALKLPRLSKKSPSCTTVVHSRSPRIPKPVRMQAQHTYRLRRTKPRESLGLVLISGEKTPDGRPESFYVKEVNPDTLAWRAGLKAGDRIVQVDYYNLSSIPPQEAVARIKDKTIVTLTILRGLVPPSKHDHTHDHIYDEIMYADQQQQLGQNLSQPEHLAPFMTTGLLKEPFPGAHRHRTGALTDKDLLSPTASGTKRRAHSPTGAQDTHHHPLMSSNGTQVTLPGEKGSKDSGLSSGSSNSPEHHRERGPVLEKQDGVEYPEDAPFERLATLRQSYRTEREMLKNFLKSRKKDSESQAEPEETGVRRNCRIEGDYEVEEIYLQKSGTSQLGVTLGYDTKTAKGHLYVCEILPTGLAYQDGRLKCGDIIRRVNGFEVYDPEEAILLFLEQDQDITLTVARKIKHVTNRLVLSNQPLQPAVEHTYAVLEAKVGGSNVPLRRVDSCGSLDSHSHKYAKGYNKAAQLEDDTGHAQKVSLTASMLKMNEAGYEYMSRTRSSSNPQARQVPHQLSVTQDVRSASRSPPRHTSPLCHSSVTPPTQSRHTPSPTPSPDCTLQPGDLRGRTQSPSQELTPPTALRARSPSQELTPPTTLRARSPSQELTPPTALRARRSGDVRHDGKSTVSSGEGIRTVPVNLRSYSNELRTCRVPNNEFVFNRSESLV